MYALKFSMMKMIQYSLYYVKLFFKKIQYAVLEMYRCLESGITTTIFHFNFMASKGYLRHVLEKGANHCCCFVSQKVTSWSSRLAVLCCLQYTCITSQPVWRYQAQLRSTTRGRQRISAQTPLQVSGFRAGLLWTRAGALVDLAPPALCACASLCRVSLGWELKRQRLSSTRKAIIP